MRKLGGTLTEKPVTPKPLIIQSDLSLLLDVHAEGTADVRALISPFAELEKSPEHFHTYRITSLSLWSAASVGYGADYVLETLHRHARYEVPQNVKAEILDAFSRWGSLVLKETRDPNFLRLETTDPTLKMDLAQRKELEPLLLPEGEAFRIPLLNRGTVKQKLIKMGYPVNDLVPMKQGDPLEFSLRKTTLGGKSFSLRPYQQESVDAFVGKNLPGSGFGTVVLPCGSGKTVVGMGVMEKLKTHTLILTTSRVSARQWIDELRDKSTLAEGEIGEYSGGEKQISPVTVGTYHVLIWRADKTSAYKHFDLFRKRNWGLIIYDEVHLLPAPVFRMVAEIQSTRRLGLTATLVREDGGEEDLFSLVGPKRFDIPWRELERSGAIAGALCWEIRRSLPQRLQIPYLQALPGKKFHLASCNPEKISVVQRLVEKHKKDSILVIGHYINQLKQVAAALHAPLLTGKTPTSKRLSAYEKFKSGACSLLVVSKMANFAVDLPNAAVIIQISGTYGSRQEEAQRLGRILRPKKTESIFYTIVTHRTVEETYSANRQRFLAEQGYRYHVEFCDGGVPS